uniref:Paraneoplastic antigen Ma-like N-terminal domain-containing protein n=1 Tax=Paramormyrops kingsleyae TaxID=1676925 RepID=A0A3B3Q7Y6_9TELE
MTHAAELVAKLKGWCRGEGLSEAHTLMVIIPDDADISEIEDTLQTVKCLGRVRVRGRTFDVKHSQLMALCECKENLKEANVPKEVLPIGGGEPWPIVVVGETLPDDTDDFGHKLIGFLQKEGKTLEELGTLFSAPDHSTDPTEAILRAVSDLLEKARPSVESRAVSDETGNGKINSERWFIIPFEQAIVG